MKNKLICMLIAICMIAVMLPAAALAGTTHVQSGDMTYPAENGDLYYQVFDGLITITGADTTVTSADIPDEIGGREVTSIGHSAFAYCSELASVDLPEGLTDIDSSAFYGCTSLESINIPANVTVIGLQAFYNCTALTSIVVPEGVTSIGARAFYRCSALRLVKTPQTRRFFCFWDRETDRRIASLLWVTCRERRPAVWGGTPRGGLPPVSLSRSKATKNLIAERSFAALRMTKGARGMTNEAACLFNAAPSLWCPLVIGGIKQAGLKKPAYSGHRVQRKKSILKRNHRTPF
ncbi:MAG: leucine-rich repeat domain-containing protein [Clostridia bacterium]|nr:leucine-rich repeat domain-containing protein [Clostridia bacterium]